MTMAPPCNASAPVGELDIQDKRLPGQRIDWIKANMGGKPSIHVPLLVTELIIQVNHQAQSR